MAFSQESAEAFAVGALAWLAGNEDLMPSFLGSTGASADDIRSQARDPGFLGAVLDFIMMDDAWVIRFCDETNVPYDRVMQARAALPGGEQVNWT